MTELTELDHAHAAMQADTDDDLARLRFFERLADSEVFLLLTEEPEGDDISPEIFDMDGQSYALVFDREERLAEFVGAEAPYAGLSGRMLASMMAGQGIGLGLNLEVAPSAMLLPSDAIDWLVDTLGNTAEETEARPVEVTAPTGLPDAVIEGLDRKLATAAGLAKAALLVAVTYDDGSKGHLLAFLDALEGAQPALVGAVGEVLTFSGIEAGALDIGFILESDLHTAQFLKVGLRFDLPVPEAPATAAPAAPGMDPDSPPKLR